MAASRLRPLGAARRTPWWLPLPLLIVLLPIGAGFWQTDADFILGRTATFDAVLIDPGLPQATRGRPRYFPTFLLASGERLQVSTGQVADELPTVGDPVRLRCSSVRPTDCRMPGTPLLDPVFYGIAGVWLLLTLLTMGLTWWPRRRRA
jgi:hypothetical protein